MQYDKNYEALGRNLPDVLREFCAEQGYDWEREEAFLRAFESLDKEASGRFIEHLGAYWASAEAKSALAESMEHRRVMDLVASVLGYRATPQPLGCGFSSWFTPDGRWDPLVDYNGTPRCTLVNRRDLGTTQRYHVQARGHHLGLCWSHAPNGHSTVCVMWYGQDEAASQQAERWLASDQTPVYYNVKGFVA